MRLISRLNQRFGAQIRDSVIQDLADGRGIQPGRLNAVTQAISVLVIATPFLITALGLTLILTGLPGIILPILGLIAIGCGWFLLPNRMRNNEPTLRRGDAPTLFALLDGISAELKAPTIHGVHSMPDLNAYMAVFGPKDRVVGIGAPFWMALAPRERLALLSHEIAHLVNGDPARSRLSGAALQTLGRWYDLATPPGAVTGEIDRLADGTVFAEILLGLFRGIISALTYGFERMIYAESQRAEYFADIKSTEVSGAAAAQALLKKLILVPIAEDKLGTTYYNGTGHIPIFEEMAETMRAPDPDKAARLMKKAVEELHRVDNTHPPTRFRMEVVGAAGAQNWCA